MELFHGPLLSEPEMRPRRRPLGALPGLLSQTECTSPPRNLGPWAWPRRGWRKFQADKADSERSEGSGVTPISYSLTSPPGTLTPGLAQELTCTTWPARMGQGRLAELLGLRPRWVASGRSLRLSWHLRIKVTIIILTPNNNTKELGSTGSAAQWPWFKATSVPCDVQQLASASWPQRPCL